MLLIARNDVLTKYREATYLTASAAVADTTLTVRAIDNNAWADNDYIIVGEIGSKNAEVMQINGAVTDGTSVTIDQSGSGGLRYAHSINEPVYRIAYNQIEFSRNTSDSTSGVSVLATIEIQPDDPYTRYDDVSNTTGYGFARYKNSLTVTYSSYSDGIPYEGQSPQSLAKMIEKVRTNINEKDDEFVSDDEIRDALNAKQRDIAHKKMWTFYEKQFSFSSVANQFAYDIPTTVKGSTIYTTLFKSQPLAPVNRERWNMLHWNTDTSTSQASLVHVWGGQLNIYPRQSSGAASTTLSSGISASATTIAVAATSTFSRGDYFRFIIDSEVIYATGSTSTTFTGCLRAQEGTTAATHSSAATVTERDIVCTGQTEPTDLVDLNDLTAIPEPEVLTDGASADLAFKLERENTQDRFLIRYKDSFKNLEGKYTVKIIGHFGHVKDPREVISDYGAVRNPNDYPNSVVL